MAIGCPTLSAPPAVFTICKLPYDTLGTAPVESVVILADDGFIGEFTNPASVGRCQADNDKQSICMLVHLSLLNKLL